MRGVVYERIMGRTEALDFVGTLSETWRKLASEYKNRGRMAECEIFTECAEMLESKIEVFANS